MAIATALMPPLCTVGYGLSRLNWAYAFGALYLFVINSIFIALATFAMVKYFRFPIASNDENNKRLPKHWLALILVLVIVPSVISAISVVKENQFMIHAEQLVNENKNLGKGFIYDHKATYSRKSPTLEIFLAGEPPTPEAMQRFYKEAEAYGITRSQIIFHDDATSMPQEFSEVEIVKGIYEHTDQQIKLLNDSIASLGAKLSDYEAKEIPIEAISQELFAQYPDIVGLSLTRGSAVDNSLGQPTEQIVAFITTTEPMDDERHDRIERWLKVRLKNDNVKVICDETEHQ